MLRKIAPPLGLECTYVCPQCRSSRLLPFSIRQAHRESPTSSRHLSSTSALLNPRQRPQSRPPSGSVPPPDSSAAEKDSPQTKTLKRRPLKPEGPRNPALELKDRATILAERLLVRKIIVNESPNGAEDTVEGSRRRNDRATGNDGSSSKSRSIDTTGLTLAQALKAAKGKGRVDPELLEKLGEIPEERQHANDESTVVLALNVTQASPPQLHYGLDRVLFNPGVYHLQDPRSRVYNFDPYLAKIIPAAEFNYRALGGFVSPSQDETLKNVAAKHDVPFYSSTSSMTGILSHFHLLLSAFRRLDLSRFSRGFEPVKNNGDFFTPIGRAPQSVFLKKSTGTGHPLRAIEIANDHSRGNLMALIGHSLELLFTTPKQEFERFRLTDGEPKPDNSGPASDAYNYTAFNKILIRSQLDARDNRLPGGGIFDVKTRAVASVRMDIFNKMENAKDYQLKNLLGTYESFERELYDMARSALLKYSLQARLGRMDGLFVAFHNVKQIFGFQYLSLSEIDGIVHGTTDTTTGDKEASYSLNMLSSVLERIQERFPNENVRITVEARNNDAPFMYIFAEPISDDQMNDVQTKSRQAQESFNRSILYGEDLESDGTDVVEELDGKATDFDEPSATDSVAPHIDALEDKPASGRPDQDTQAEQSTDVTEHPPPTREKSSSSVTASIDETVTHSQDQSDLVLVDATLKDTAGSPVEPLATLELNFAKLKRRVGATSRQIWLLRRVSQQVAATVLQITQILDIWKQYDAATRELHCIAIDVRLEILRQEFENARTLNKKQAINVAKFRRLVSQSFKRARKSATESNQAGPSPVRNLLKEAGKLIDKIKAQPKAIDLELKKYEDKLASLSENYQLLKSQETPEDLGTTNRSTVSESQQQLRTLQGNHILLSDSISFFLSAMNDHRHAWSMKTKDDPQQRDQLWEAYQVQALRGELSALKLFLDNGRTQISALSKSLQGETERGIETSQEQRKLSQIRQHYESHMSSLAKLSAELDKDTAEMNPAVGEGDNRLSGAADDQFDEHEEEVFNDADDLFDLDETEAEVEDRSGSTVTDSGPEAETQSTSIDSTRPLLALVLTHTSKVNNIPVTRTQDLIAEDDWTVSYAIEEIADAELAWSRYDSTMKRRNKAYATANSDDKFIRGWYNGAYIRQLAKMGEQGRVWKERMERLDREKGVVVFRSSHEEGVEPMESS